MNATCKDCGKPVHVADEPCTACGEPTWYHDSAADALACRGLGFHVAPVHDHQFCEDMDEARETCPACLAEAATRKAMTS